MSTVVKDLGAVSAYAYAVEKGYTGTEAEFAELMADYAEVGERAEDAAESALNSKTAAQTAATTATDKASEATTAAQTATTKAGEASRSASEANTAKEEAVTAQTAAETAQGKAEDAQAAAESVAESIPSDYSQLSEDVSQIKEDLQDIDERVEVLEAGGTGGISMTAVNLLNTILSEAVYGTDQTANITLLKKELSNVAPVSISAVLDGTALAGQSYSELSFIVTATFDDESTAVVDNYTVVTTGTVTAGSNTVTIKYRGVTTTCTFTAESVTTHSITYNLTNATSSNDTTVVVENRRYATEISTDSDHYIGTFTVTMGGVDVTATVRNGNNIVIDAVTGNVVITVVANAYVYLDPLIIKRPYTNEGDTARFYTDEYVTQANPATLNYMHVGKVTEYPAKYDCTLNWTITNTSDETLALGSNNSTLGFGLIKDTDEYINNNAIAYWQKIDNTSHSLEPNESISGTYQMKAGWQLILTTNVAQTAVLTERIRGDYVAEDFSDYTIVNSIVTSDVKAKDPYKTRTFYSDDGTTSVKTQGGYLYEYESAGRVGSFERDAVVKMTPIDISGRNPIGSLYTAFVSALSDENVYYAQAAQINIRCSNLWRHITLTAPSSNMYWVFNGPVEQNYTLTVKAKEVSE